MSKGNKMDQAALRYHSEGRPGKIAVVPTKPYHTQHDLSLAYSPGVAAPCRAIEANPDDVYRYTNKGNLIAVISNGTAVLGLGNIGALAGKPVMEGKSMLFKTFADIDAFDIEVDETDPEAFIRTVKAIAPTFGGINLEDIKAPECFEIDRRLSEELDIPVMHDDQHGTAVISTAALLNAAKIAGKALDKLRVVVNGAGAAAIACARLFIAVGVRRENMIFCDSQGVVTTYRTDINEIKTRIRHLPPHHHPRRSHTRRRRIPRRIQGRRADSRNAAHDGDQSDRHGAGQYPIRRSPTTKPSFRVPTSSLRRAARTTPIR